MNAVGLISGFVRLFSRKSSRSTFKSGKTGTLSESLLDWEDSNKQFFFWAELSGDETSLLPEFVFDRLASRRLDAVQRNAEEQNLQVGGGMVLLCIVASFTWPSL